MGRAAAHSFLLALALAPAGSTAAAPQPPRGAEPPYAETVVVVESSVVVEMPSTRPDATAEQVVVLEGGVAREVTRVEPLGGEDPWDLLVWIDGALCRPASLGPTLLGLARHAAVLARLGRVRVVLAGEQPRVVVPPPRDVSELEVALAGLGREEAACQERASALLWEARAATTPGDAERVLGRLADLVESRGRMLADAAGPCPHDACAVLLVAHGYPLELDLALPERVRSAGTLAMGSRLRAATDELARRLALARWALLALPLVPPAPPGREEGLAPEDRPGPDAIPPREHMPSGYGRKRDRDESQGVLVKVWPRGRKRRARTDALPAGNWDVFLLPDLAHLRALADATGGMMLRVAAQLEPALEELSGRTRVWYRTTPLAPGEVRSLVVTVGSPPRRALAPAWVGSHPPPPPATP